MALDYKKEIGDFSKKNEISSTPCIHDKVGKVVNIGGRNVTTMTSDHSQANNTWSFPGNETARNADFYENNGNGKETLQDQNFDELKKACCAIGVDLQPIQYSWPSSIINDSTDAFIEFHFGLKKV